MRKFQNDEWIRCEVCRHKLMKILDVSKARIEIKCHSCKAINTINLPTKEENK